MNIMWFREDLRVRDNTALYYSAKSGKGVSAFVVASPSQWRKHHMAEVRIAFWWQHVFDLANTLRQYSIPLQVITCDEWEKLPPLISKFAVDCKAQALYFNNEYELNEMARDNAVEAAMTALNIKVFRYHDEVLLAPDQVHKLDGKPYTQFSHFKRAFLRVQASQPIQVFAEPNVQSKCTYPIENLSMDVFLSKAVPSIWKVGEKHAALMLDCFADRAGEYAELRDYPAIEGTSRLSPYLAVGSISVRQCWAKATQWAEQGNLATAGAEAWLNELIWREFYKHLLFNFPDISRYQPFQPQAAYIPWRNNEEEFFAWCEGKTGYPIVDAGMRQLVSEGWMHNRLRMVTAMFLCKLLLIDWRWGEKFFMQHLIDGDLSSNNGGWQWCASTGSDSVPYFRIFNPYLQSMNYDPNGEFIRKYCTAISSLVGKNIHMPQQEDCVMYDYPMPIVDYTSARQRALSEYSKIYRKRHSTLR